MSFIAQDIAEAIIADIGLPPEYQEKIERLVDARIECHRYDNQHSSTTAGRGHNSTTTTNAKEQHHAHH